MLKNYKAMVFVSRYLNFLTETSELTFFSFAGSLHGKINHEPKKMKNSSRQCGIYHIKEKNSNFNMQKKFSSLVPLEKKLREFEVK